MSANLHVRPVERGDFTQWLPLWEGYNAFYGRQGPTALPETITQSTWERFFRPDHPVQALVAVHVHEVVGLAHYFFHPSTSRLSDVCYLQDLFTVQKLRGQGIGRSLISGVFEVAKRAGCSRVYWQTQTSNVAGRALYDKLATHDGFIVYTHEL